MYEATAQTRAPIDVMGTLASRWPNVSPDDLRAHLTSLAGQGLLALRGDGAGLITENGVRVLAHLWQTGAFGAYGVEAQQQQEQPSSLPQNNEHEAAALVAPTSTGGPGMGVIRVQRLRRELDALTQDLSAATDLPMNEWSQALELTSALETSLDELERLLTAMQAARNAV